MSQEEAPRLNVLKLNRSLRTRVDVVLKEPRARLSVMEVLTGRGNRNVACHVNVAH